MPILTEIDAVRELLATSPTIAVLGAHTESDRAACFVPDYLHEQGYRVIAVNPRFAGQTLWNERAVATVADLEHPVDMVDVFRPAHALGAHLPELMAMDPLPRSVWLQLGIRSDPFAQALSDAGIAVVQDRCTLADHKRWSLGAPRQS